MKLRRSTARALAVLAVFVMFAAACGGGSDEGAIGPDPDASADAAPGEVSGPIATTAPLVVTDDATVTETPEAPSDAGAGLPPEDLNEVTVLHVNDDVQIVPAFDGPNGNNIKLYDVNTVDSPNVELEYPLYAETHFKNRLALLVKQFDSSGAWAEVYIPVRPNNTTAWVQTAFFSQETHSYNITVDLSENKVYVYDGTTELIEGGQLAVSGRESRPTPILRSYIDEKIPGDSVSPAYGDWILSIAAFSETLGTFGGGGMPKLALHGTNQPELMGQYVSSGCVRIPNEIVSFIADTVPVGTIVNIVA